MLTDTIRLLLFPALMAFAASSDLFTMTISNRVSIVLIAGFFAMALLTGMAGSEILWHVAAGALVLTVTFGCFVAGWIGGGDAKLAAATALWFGFDHLVTYLLYASLFGGVLTLLMIQLRAVPLPAMLAGKEWAERLHNKDGGIPYGIALAAAALLVYPETAWMKTFAA
jgi:prepilin peptidase CpaA